MFDQQQIIRRGKKVYLVVHDEIEEPTLFWHDALFQKEQSGERLFIQNKKKTATIKKEETRYILETGNFSKKNALRANTRDGMRHMLSEFCVGLAGW